MPSISSDVDDIWAQLKRDNSVSKTSKTSTKFDKVWTKIASGKAKISKSETSKTLSDGEQNVIETLHPKETHEVSDSTGSTVTDNGSKSRSQGLERLSHSGQNESVDISIIGAVNIEAKNNTEAVNKARDIKSSEELLQRVRHDLNIIINVSEFTQVHDALERLAFVVEHVPSEYLDGGAVDIAKPLLRCLVDKKSVRVRELAGRILHLMLTRIPDAAIELQGYIIPTVLERFYKRAPQESLSSEDNQSGDTDSSFCRDAPGGYASLHTSYGQFQRQQKKMSREDGEDVLLLLIRIARLTTIGAGNAIQAYVNDLLTIVASATLDEYHAVTIEASELTVSVLRSLGFSSTSTHAFSANSLPPAHLKFLSRGFIYWICPLLSAKRSEVRISAIKAITRCVLCYGHESILDMSAWRDPNMVPIKAFYGQDLKVNYFGKLSTDRNPRVRYSFLCMLGEWLIDLPEARNDHEYRLLPYVLSAVSDNTNATITNVSNLDNGQKSTDEKDSKTVNIAREAILILAEVGKQYELENDDEIKKLRSFSPELLRPICCQSMPCLIKEEKYCNIENFRYPFPFNDLKSLLPVNLDLAYGTRISVFACFKRLQHPIVKEMREWKPETGGVKISRISKPSDSTES